MGRNHFPPPESSPRSNKPPIIRRSPGNQRIEAKPHNSRPSTPPKRNNKLTSRPPPDRNHGNSYRTDHRRALRHRANGAVGHGHGQDIPVKYDQRDQKDPPDVRLRLPEKLYTKGGESFVDVMKKPVPNPVIMPRVIPRLEIHEDTTDQIFRKPNSYTESNRSAGNSIASTPTATSQSQIPDLNLNLDQDQDLNLENSFLVEKTDELPILKENIWGAGSFVDVLKKPIPIPVPIPIPIPPHKIDVPPSTDSAMNDKNRNGYQNQKRYYDRKDRSVMMNRGRKLGFVNRPNRKEHHSRGEEIDASKKKIRTPEKPVDLPKFEFPGTGNENPDENDRHSKDLESVSFVEVNAPVENTATFVDGIFHRRSFVDVVRRGAPPPLEIQAAYMSNLPDPSIYPVQA